MREIIRQLNTLHFSEEVDVTKRKEDAALRALARKQYKEEGYLPPRNLDFPISGAHRSVPGAGTLEPRFASAIEVEEDLVLFRRLGSRILGLSEKKVSPDSPEVIRRAKYLWIQLRHRPENPLYGPFREWAGEWRRLIRTRYTLLDNGDMSSSRYDRRVGNPHCCGFCGQVVVDVVDDDEPAM